MTDENKNELNGSWLDANTDASAISSPRFDPDEFREYVEHYDLTEEQENELLETLWNILRTFVELGFGLNSVQTIFTENLENALRAESDSVKEKDYIKNIANADGDNTERSP